MACPRLLTTRATRAASRSLSTQRPPPSRPSPVAHTASESRFNYLPGTPTSPFDPAPPSPELASYRLVTPADLLGRQEPPKRVRMLAGDFIEDSLYNPNYGYFATKVEIFDPDRAQLKHRERERGGKAGEGEARRRKTGEKRAASEAVAPLTPVEGVVRAEGFDFTQFASTAAFEDEVAHRYMVFEGRGSREGEEDPVAGEKVGRQVWHTPTELFKPWYGRALARYLLSQYLSSPPPSASSSSSSLPSSTSSTATGTIAPSYPYDDLIIYEIGGGNGTLMGDILDYLAAEAPEVYARTKYRIVEISERLKGMQETRAAGRKGKGKGRKGGEVEVEGTGGDSIERELQEVRRRGHEDKVEVIRKSIFEWERRVEEPCFFLAMEVLDNFPHDVVRYSLPALTPLQCTIAIDASGDFTELFTPVTSPLIARYLSLRSQLSPSAPDFPPPGCLPLPLRYLPPVLAAPLLRLYALLPFAPNLTLPEFVPTRQLQLLEVLRDKFPRHRVVMSDFETLPEAVEGECGPVVQTRYAGETVPCTTYLVQPGFFDIFFPTSFNRLASLYSLVMSQPSSPSLPSSPSSSSEPAARPSEFFTPTRERREKRTMRVLEHAEFLERYAEKERTRMRDGSNPLLESYGNARWVVS